jgi:signal transduction histidine kinase
MDMQQMMQQLLAKAKANQDLLARMEAETDANPAKASKQEEMLAEISDRINTNLKDLKEYIKSGQAEMRSTICAFRSELKETIQHEMKAVIQPMRSELDVTTACNGVTETEPEPG